ncbi:helix-turn-helix transcriptional regulator [Streptomyces sp. S3(2020)]|uniref:helix-turn-helix transcriptional regulator n=1 Tax=Streptomyces sp. S3(2020) TaxID=2732044 RepID=UPI0014889BF5|nr:helix-turn-helix transcriptional regulator [Streptomyces sp. S3(2020)]NNN33817.1 helix-turn-helix transcriptional regulator [Streptomyces sp. S3(2020)]
MSRHSVTERHLRLMLDVVDEARHDDSGEFPPPSLLEGLGRLVPCDLAEFSEVDLPTRRGLGYQAVQYGGPYPEWDDEVWWLWKHQHPHCVEVEHSHGHLEVAQLTDYMATREFRDTALYTDYMRPFVAMMVVALPTAPGRIRMYSVSRDRDRPFSERDRLTLQLLRPHLHAVYREAARRRREPVRLTPRELDVLRAVANGWGTEDIAGQFVVSTSTVRKHLENIFRKLDVSSRTAAVARVFPETEASSP